MAEGLFDYNAAPVAAFLAGQAGIAEMAHHLPEERGSGGEIVEVVAPGAVLLVYFGQQRLEALVVVRIAEIARDIVSALHQPFAEGTLVGSFAEFGQVRTQALAKLLLIHLLDGAAQQGEFLRQKVFLREVVERRNQLALGEIARRAEDRHHAAVGRFAVPRAVRLFAHFFSPPAARSTWPPNW